MTKPSPARRIDAVETTPDSGARVAPPRPAGTPPARRPMTLAERVAKTFPPKACLRGYELFASGGVALGALEDSSSGCTLAAVVTGKRRREVRLRGTGDRVLARCTCSATELGLVPCMHVWATLLEVDRQNLFVGLRERVGPVTFAFEGGPDAPPPPPKSAARTISRRGRPPKTERPRTPARGPGASAKSRKVAR